MMTVMNICYISISSLNKCLPLSDECDILGDILFYLSAQSKSFLGHWLSKGEVAIFITNWLKAALFPATISLGRKRYSAEKDH